MAGVFTKKKQPLAGRCLSLGEEMEEMCTKIMIVYQSFESQDQTQISWNPQRGNKDIERSQRASSAPCWHPGVCR